MNRPLSFLTAVTLALVFPIHAARAESNASTPEARLRDALRNTVLQLRTAENDRAALQAAQAESATEKKTLTAQVEALTKQCKADKESAEKTIASLNARLAEQAGEIDRLREGLAKWESACKQATAVAQSKEGERARLADQAVTFERTVADQKTKNAALFKLGNEILTRYEKFGLGEALGAKEPFVGIKRVTLQNLVQDYQDKLSEQRITPAR